MLFVRKLFREVLILKMAARAQNSNNVNSILPGHIETTSDSTGNERWFSASSGLARPASGCQHVSDLFDAV
jgi:hypothetical protein